VYLILAIDPIPSIMVCDIEKEKEKETVNCGFEVQKEWTPDDEEQR
jgi:hypothetical protein